MPTPDPLPSPEARTATALVHELRNALVPLHVGLERGTATLADVAAVVARLFAFADELAADLRTTEESKALVPLTPAEMPPCDLDDRASIVAFLNAKVQEHNAAAREVRNEVSYSTAKAAMHAAASTAAVLCSTLATQVARGDDRLDRK